MVKEPRSECEREESSLGSKEGRVKRAVWPGGLPPAESGEVRGYEYRLRSRDTVACTGPWSPAPWVREVGLGQRRTHTARVMQ